MTAALSTALRLGAPIIEDAAYLARRMRADEIAQFLAVQGLNHYDPDQAARCFLSIPGQQYVLVDANNLPVLLGGFQPIRPGVVEGWQVGTAEGWAKHWRSITKASRRLIDHLMTDGIHRIQVCAVASREQKTFDWYERGLGLHPEAVLKRYCADGQDAYLFVRTAP